jgi:hypothetical protein
VVGDNVTSNTKVAIHKSVPSKLKSTSDTVIVTTTASGSRHGGGGCNESRAQGSIAATESGISESYKASEVLQPITSELSLLAPPVQVDRHDPNILRDLPGHFPVSSHSHASGYVISTVPIIQSGGGISSSSSSSVVPSGPIIESVMKFRAASDARRLGRVSGNVPGLPTDKGNALPTAPRYRRITPTYLGPLESRHLFLPVQMNNFR